MKKLLLLIALIAGLCYLSSCGGKEKELTGTYVYEMPDTKGETYLILNEDGTCRYYAQWVDSIESTYVESASAVGQWEYGLTDNLIHIDITQKGTRIEELITLTPSADNDTLTDPTGRQHIRLYGSISPIEITDTLIITPIHIETEEECLMEENGYQHNGNYNN